MPPTRPLLALALLLAPASAFGEEPSRHRPVLVIVDPSVDLSAAEIRAAIAAELGTAAVAPPSAGEATRGTFIIWKESSDRLVVTFHDPAQYETQRVLRVSETPTRTIVAIALLAGNLARDQTAGLVKEEPKAALVAPVAPAAPVAAAAPADVPTSDGSTLRTLGWLSLAAGGGALAWAGYEVSQARRWQAQTDQNCTTSQVCSASAIDSNDRARTHASRATFAVATGLVGVGAGVTMLVLAPSSRPSGPQIGAWVGAGSAGVLGKF